MSLIALTMNDCYKGHIPVPFILADILISSKEQIENVSIPTFINGIDEFLEEKAERMPYGVLQKIYVITDHIAIMLAGDVDEMKSILIAAKEFVKYESWRNASLNKDFTTESIIDLLENYIKPLGFTKSSFCIIFIDESSRLSTFPVGRWLIGKSPAFGNFLATGSSASDFSKHLFLQSPKVVNDSLGWFVLVNHMNLLGYLVGLENQT